MELSRPSLSSDCLVLLITIDSLRRDFAYAPENMQFMQSGGNMKFPNAFSQGGGTPESFPTIMCSTPPPYHFEDRQILGQKSIAKLLKECGFATAGFHSNPFLGSRDGYGEGFDHFFEGASSENLSIPRKLNGAKNAANLLLRNKGPIVDGQEITRKALSWLKTTESRRKFMWIHFMDTHFPYLPKTRNFGISDSLNNRALWAILLASRSQYKRARPSPETKAAVIRAYTACIQYVDECLSLIFSESTKRCGELFSIVTSDHGEAFWEHDFFGHSGVYDEILKIPMFIYSKSLIGRDIQRLVFLADIFPTISGLMDQRLTATCGEDIFTARETAEKDRGFVCTSLDIPLESRTIGFRNSRFKYFRREKLKVSSEGVENLFDLSGDCNETLNVIDSHQAEAEIFRGEIAKIYAERRPPQTDFSYEDEEEITRRLKALGYV